MGNILGYYVMPHPPIIIPEVGRGEEIKVSKTIEACEKVADEIKDLKPEVIIIITPHGPLFRDAIAVSHVPTISGNLRRFGAPHVKFEENINMHLTENIIRYADEENIYVAPITENSLKENNVLCELDHGSMVPLYYINKKYRDYELVHITYGMLPKIDLYKFGMAIKKAVEDEEFNAVIIASGDLSHRLSNDGPYEYNPLGKEFDREVLKLLQNGDTIGVFSMDRHIVDAAGECGLRSFYIMLGSMEGKFIKGELLSYEGTFGVGYGVMRFDFEEDPNREFLDKLIEMKEKEISKRRENEDAYVRLARQSLEYFIKHGKYMNVPEDLPPEMLKEKRGVFVSIKKEGELRGCIGTIFPSTDSVAEEIIRNAVEAGERDPRFFPVEEEELEELEYSVDVLMPPVKASRDELDPKKYGVIVRKGSMAGLLLPDLEGVDTVEKQLSIALSKAGISENEDYTIEKFEVIRHR
jgi:AmmeMemoRadiSam system protein A